MACSGSCCGTARSLAKGVVLGVAAVVAVDSVRARQLELPSEEWLAVLGVAVLALAVVERRSRGRSVDGQGADGRGADDRGDDTPDRTDGTSTGGGHGVDVGEHYRATVQTRDSGVAAGDTSGASRDDRRAPDGVYRVVGAGDPIALLRVTDADGRRRHTGDLVRAPPHAIDSEFEPAADPDAGLSPVRSVRNQLSGLYWSVRRFFYTTRQK